MSRCGWTLCRLLLCGLIGCCLTPSTGAFAAPPSTQNAKPEVKEGAPAKTQEQMMSEMVKLGTPDPNHEMLKNFEGTWKTFTNA